MNIYPAVDLLDGKCVRLKQGEVSEVTVYYDDPLDAAKRWVDAGAEWLHIIDLNGAIKGERVHADLIKKIRAELQIKIQVGGGIRDRLAVMDYLEAGIDRVILGTAACEDEKFVKAALGVYGEKIAVSIDAKNGIIALRGWRKLGNKTAVSLARDLKEWGLQTLIYTDIARDGMLEGANVNALQIIAENFGPNVIASGGITTIDDLDLILPLAGDGVEGIIIGRALYEDTLSLEEALSAVK